MRNWPVSSHMTWFWCRSALCFRTIMIGTKTMDRTAATCSIRYILVNSHTKRMPTSKRIAISETHRVKSLHECEVSDSNSNCGIPVRNHQFENNTALVLTFKVKDCWHLTSEEKKCHCTKKILQYPHSNCGSSHLHTYMSSTLSKRTLGTNSLIILSSQLDSSN